MKKPSLPYIFLLVIIILTITACGSSAISPSPRCQTASIRQTKNIRDGVQSTASSNDIGSAWAVKSGDYQNVWFVAAEIKGPGIEPGQVIGLWAISGDPDDPGLTFSANAIAFLYSGYGEGSKTKAHISQLDDGAQEAISCATP
jgi:hypothetical protein